VYVSKIGFQRADGFPPTTYVFLSSQHLPSASVQPAGCMLASAALSCSYPITTWGQLIVQAAGLRLAVSVVPWVFFLLFFFLRHRTPCFNPCQGALWVDGLSSRYTFVWAVHQFQCLRSGFGYSDRLIYGKRHDYTLRLAEGTCISILPYLCPCDVAVSLNAICDEIVKLVSDMCNRHDVRNEGAAPPAS
jgi:hypothetical protein